MTARTKPQSYECPGSGKLFSGSHTYKVEVDARDWTATVLTERCSFHQAKEAKAAASEPPPPETLAAYIGRLVAALDGGFTLPTKGNEDMRPVRVRVLDCLVDPMDLRWEALMKERRDWRRLIVRHLGPEPPRDMTLVAILWDLFFDKVVVESGVRFPTKVDTPCWWWVGVPDGRIWDAITVGGMVVAAHRWGYEQLFGLIPEGYDPQKRCDNTMCVNAYHMVLQPGPDAVTGKVAKKGKKREVMT